MQALPDAGVDPKARPYLEQFRAVHGTLAGSGVEWLTRSRAASMADLCSGGFPTQRDENWKYTPLRPVMAQPFSLAAGAQTPEDPGRYGVPGLDSLRIVCVDGVLDSRHAPAAAGLTVRSFSDMLEEDSGRLQACLGKAVGAPAHGFALLNDALHRDGVVIEIAPHARIDGPVELLLLSCDDSALVLPRVLVIASEGCRVEIIEHQVSAHGGSGLCCGMTEMYLESGAHVRYRVIQNQSRAAYQVSGTWAELAENSRLDCCTVSVGGALTRNDLSVNLSGPGAHCDMLGAYCLSGRQHVDNHTTVVHAAEDCTSNELYKGVLDDRSRGVFHGRIRVEEGAQKTDAQQANNTLLLSRGAEIDTKPQLEIYADDVKCSHGATVGQLDDKALFYLRTRGIDPEAARSMLISAFVGEVLQSVEPGPLHDYLRTLLDGQLSNPAPGEPGA